MLDDWLLDGPPEDPVLRGLAANPAAPEHVLLRLLEPAFAEYVPGSLRRRADLPPAVIDAMLHHGLTRVRAAVAANPAVDPRIRIRLLDDPFGQVVDRLYADRDLPLPDHAFTRMLDRLGRMAGRGMISQANLCGKLLEQVDRDPRLLHAAAVHLAPPLRLAACSLLERMGEADRQALLHDDAPEVRAAAAARLADEARPREPADLPASKSPARSDVLRAPLSPALAEQVMADGDEDDHLILAGNPTAPAAVIAALLEHPSAKVRSRLADRDDLTAEQLARLAADPVSSVRTAVSTHPGFTEERRAAIAIDAQTTPGEGRSAHTGYCACYTVPRREQPVPAESARWATSVSPLLRRRAARDPQLPADLVAVLADDADAGVRLLLAQHHPAAPGPLLLQCFLWYRGCGRDRLAALPGFPVDGLARFADDPDPAVRALVARDPAADPALVDRLTADPDQGVRKAMASCPRLPEPRIVELLDDAELAGSAAANPSLPVPAMERILAGTALRRA